MTCTDGCVNGMGAEGALGPDLVALALGQISPEEAAKVESHLASCAPCRAELAATKSLFAVAAKTPAPELSDGAEARLLAAFRAERANGPATDVPPPATKRRGAAKLLATWLPLAAAASVVVMVYVSSSSGPQAEVIEGEGILRVERPTSIPDVVLRGKFDFEEGDEIAAGKAFTVRLTQKPGERTPVAGQPDAGLVEIRLLPMAHLRRSGASEVELEGGAVEVAAGPLAEPFTIRAGRGPGYAVVRGTRLLATTADDRLVVVVREGAVELGRRDGPSQTLSAGEQGLVDSERLLRRPADARGDGDTLLTPRLSLARQGAELAFEAVLTVGEGGPVPIQPFDDAEPRFVLEVRRPGTAAREVKLQRSMLAASPETGTRRLAPDAPYRLSFSLAGIGLEPGRSSVSIRYMSYRHRGDGAEWLGVVESDPVDIEVPGK